MRRQPEFTGWVKIVWIGVLFVCMPAAKAMDEMEPTCEYRQLVPALPDPKPSTLRDMARTLEFYALRLSSNQIQETLDMLAEYDRTEGKSEGSRYALRGALNVLSVSSRFQALHRNYAGYREFALDLVREQGAQALQQEILDLAKSKQNSDAFLVIEGLKLLSQSEPEGSDLAKKTAQQVIRHLDAGKSYITNEKVLKVAVDLILEKSPHDATAVLYALSKAPRSGQMVITSPEKLSPMLFGVLAKALEAPDESPAPKASEVSDANEFLGRLYRKNLAAYDELKKAGNISLALSHLQQAREFAGARRLYFQGLKKRDTVWTVQVGPKKGPVVEIDVVDYYAKEETRLSNLAKHDERQIFLAQHSPRPKGWRLFAPLRALFQ